MLNKFMMTRLLAGAAFAAASLGGSAFAGPKIFASSGSFITFNGSVETNSNNNVDPFVVEVFSAGNECLRVAVTSQGSDLETTLTSPSGAHWRDDDTGGSLRPLVKAITTQRGWYILRISSFNGAAVNSDFTAIMHRLPSTHLACASPTPPVTSFLSRTAKGTAPAGTFAPPAGGAQR